jgi:hypothetical protein
MSTVSFFFAAMSCRLPIAVERLFCPYRYTLPNNSGYCYASWAGSVK